MAHEAFDVGRVEALEKEGGGGGGGDAASWSRTDDELMLNVLRCQLTY